MTENLLKLEIIGNSMVDTVSNQIVASSDEAFMLGTYFEGFNIKGMKPFAIENYNDRRYLSISGRKGYLHKLDEKIFKIEYTSLENKKIEYSFQLIPASGTVYSPSIKVTQTVDGLGQSSLPFYGNNNYGYAAPYNNSAFNVDFTVTIDRFDWTITASVNGGRSRLNTFKMVHKPNGPITLSIDDGKSCSTMHHLYSALKVFKSNDFPYIESIIPFNYASNEKGLYCHIISTSSMFTYYGDADEDEKFIKMFSKMSAGWTSSDSYIELTRYNLNESYRASNEGYIDENGIAFFRTKVSKKEFALLNGIRLIGSTSKIWFEINGKTYDKSGIEIDNPVTSKESHDALAIGGKITSYSSYTSKPEFKALIDALHPDDIFHICTSDTGVSTYKYEELVYMLTVFELNSSYWNEINKELSMNAITRGRNIAYKIEGPLYEKLTSNTDELSLVLNGSSEDFAGALVEFYYPESIATISSGDLEFITQSDKEVTMLTSKFDKLDDVLSNVRELEYVYPQPDSVPLSRIQMSMDIKEDYLINYGFSSSKNFGKLSRADNSKVRFYNARKTSYAHHGEVKSMIEDHGHGYIVYNTKTKQAEKIPYEKMTKELFEEKGNTTYDLLKLDCFHPNYSIVTNVIEDGDRLRKRVVRGEPFDSTLEYIDRSAYLSRIEITYDFPTFEVKQLESGVGMLEGKLKSYGRSDNSKYRLRAAETNLWNSAKGKYYLDGLVYPEQDSNVKRSERLTVGETFSINNRKFAKGKRGLAFEITDDVGNEFVEYLSVYPNNTNPIKTKNMNLSVSTSDAAKQYQGTSNKKIHVGKIVTDRRTLKVQGISTSSGRLYGDSIFRALKKDKDALTISGTGPYNGFEVGKNYDLSLYFSAGLVGKPVKNAETKIVFIMEE